jgi:predicted pyridoxine 5'-phosphate oxidase superfamily flavin-nucleotide-binding protein
VERAIVFTVAAWDVNCPQHIEPRFTKEQLAPIIDPLKTRIDELETILKNKQIEF